MLGATNWRVGGRWSLLAAIVLAGFGCQSSTTSGNPAKLAIADKKDPNSPVTSVSDPAKQPAQFMSECLQALNHGKLSPDLLTLSFKKKIARPQHGNEEDVKLGYDPHKVEAYLKKLNSGSYSEKFTFTPASSGPWILGEVKSAAGQTEGYAIHLIPIQDTNDWRIDWFHRSKVYADHVDNPGPELVGAELAVHCFMDNLLGGDPLLAEAALAPAWKRREYPSSTPSDADVGYNQQLVLRKLTHDWKTDCPHYSFTRRDVAAGKPAHFEVIALNDKKEAQKTYALTVNKNAGGEWLIDEIEVK